MSKEAKTARRLLIAGCGAIGQQLARRLVAEGWIVYGLRRNVAALDSCIRPLAADLSQPLPELPDVDAMIYTATPQGRDVTSYRQAYVDGMARLLAARPSSCERFISVSSTSVLGGNGGQWVDEQTVAQPEAETAHVLLDAESLALSHGGIILRLAGIYGPQRLWLLRQAAQRDLVCAIDPPQWTNRIHEYDCAEALRHLLNLAAAEGIYHGVDDVPATRYEVLTWLRGELKLPPPLPPPSAPLLNSAAPTEAGGKRVSNQRLRATGWVPQYTDYRVGYRSILEALPENAIHTSME